MNLELNFKENPYVRFSKPPYENNKLYNTYHSSSGGVSNIDLHSIESFMSEIDFEAFTKYTTMEHVIKFNNLLESFNNHYASYFPDYTFEVTPSYIWKRGVYDALKDWYLRHTGFNKRNSGIEHFFNRISSNSWIYGNVNDRLVALDNQRQRARRAVGTVIDNLDELIVKFNDNIQKINDSTEKANNFSKLYKVYNHIVYPNYINKVEDLQESDYTRVRLYTVVITEPKDMLVMRGDNEKLFYVKVPRTYMHFNRPLYKALTGNGRTSDITCKAASPGGRHPYIDMTGQPFYNRRDAEVSLANNVYRMNNYAWNTLCLSSFSDDIQSALAKNDYVSFISNISFWNSIYNMDSTQPYNHPKTIFYQLGIPNIDTAEDIKILSGFNERECFHQNMDMRKYVEENNDIRQYVNREIRTNYYLYGSDIKNDCDAKECAFRGKCSDYINLSNISEDYVHIIESITGATLEYERREMKSYHNNLYRFSLLYTSILKVHPDDVFIALYNKLEDIKYWDTPIKLTAEEKMTTWINSNSVSHDTQRNQARTLGN